MELLKGSVAGLVTLHPIDNYLDALPVKMFEYMASGIPVIASDFTLWRTIVDDNRCGICVDPLERDSIVKAISFIMENPIEAQEMGINGRQAVVEKYNWKLEERKLLDISHFTFKLPFGQPESGRLLRQLKLRSCKSDFWIIE